MVDDEAARAVSDLVRDTDGLIVSGEARGLVERYGAVAVTAVARHVRTTRGIRNKAAVARSRLATMSNADVLAAKTPRRTMVADLDEFIIQ
jgi:hypothetical protein